MKNLVFLNAPLWINQREKVSLNRPLVKRKLCGTVSLLKTRLRQGNIMGSLETAQAKYDMAKARLQRIKNREASNVRKMETRRKIILGAMLIADIKRSPELRAKVMEQLRSLPRDFDRKLFENWDVENG